MESWFKSHAGVLFPVFISVFAVSLFIFIVYITWPNTSDCNRPTDHAPGDLVRSVLDGRPGMVVSAGCTSYRVRFTQHQLVTPNNLFGSGGPIDQQFYSLEYMRPFEIIAKDEFKEM